MLAVGLVAIRTPLDALDRERTVFRLVFFRPVLQLHVAQSVQAIDCKHLKHHIATVLQMEIGHKLGLSNGLRLKSLLFAMVNHFQGVLAFCRW